MLVALPAGPTCASRAQGPEPNPNRCVGLGCGSEAGAGFEAGGLVPCDQAVRAGCEQVLSSRRLGGAGDRADGGEALGASRSLGAGSMAERAPAPRDEGMNASCLVVVAFM
jgi:hypothetical protein